ncbi:MAG TPA: helix-turn-helix domain-containing protein [Gammaproteobacteria bacterium]|nr:helix-turn-helix domain-containing protein [Gammaproteobacteria bacterium]
MKEPIFVRSLTDTERTALRAGLRASDAFTLRRSQILLQSEARHTPRQIGRQFGCTDQTVRNVIRAFEAEGVACLGAKSSRPLSAKPELNEKKTEQLRELLHRSPRDFGKGRSTWTLELAAEVCFEQQLTEKRVSDETIRQALLRLGVKWQRARDWITSPDPQYLRKKSGVIA